MNDNKNNFSVEQMDSVIQQSIRNIAWGIVNSAVSELLSQPEIKDRLRELVVARLNKLIVD